MRQYIGHPARSHRKHIHPLPASLPSQDFGGKQGTSEPPSVEIPLQGVLFPSWRGRRSAWPSWSPPLYLPTRILRFTRPRPGGWSGFWSPMRL